MKNSKFCGCSIFLFPFLFLSLIIVQLNCADSLDKSPVSGIPDSEIPDDITAVSSNTGSLQIKGGSVGKDQATVYIRFEDVKYYDADVWIRLSSQDSSYTFEEILNREPNNFINDITYEYVLKKLSAVTIYNLWLVWQSGVEIEQTKTNFKTLSE